MGVDSVARSTGNQFLDHMPAAAMQRLKPHLLPVGLLTGAIVGFPDGPIETVFFPINSIISVVLDMSDGETAEVGFIGREGMTGVVLALGQSTANQRSVVQVPNGAYSLDADVFRDAVESITELKAYVLRYAQAILMMSAQISACNTLHPVNERCARWLLMAHDRVKGELIRLTQEFLGQMLGVWRGSITTAASAMQEAGFISYTRGNITMLNRAGLESATCECYDTIKNNWRKIMGYTIEKPPSDEALETDKISA